MGKSGKNNQYSPVPGHELEEVDKINRRPPNEKKEKSVSFLELYRYATWLDGLCVILGTSFTIGAGVCAPIMMIFFGQATGSLIDYAAFLLTPNTTELDLEVAKEHMQSGILEFTIGTCILGVVTIICSYSSTLLYNTTANRQVHQIRSNYVKSVLNQDISWYDLHKTGDFASRISEDLMKIEDGIGEKVAIFLYFVSSFLSGIILAFIKGWKLSLVCVISIPLSSVSMGIISWVTTKFAKKETDAYGAAGAIAEETLSSIRTVVAFEGQQKELNRYTSHLRRAKTSNITRSLFTSISAGSMWFFLYSCIALSFWYGVKLILDDRNVPPEEVIYTPANMITVFFSILNSGWLFGQCTPYFVIFGLAQGSAAKIFEVIDNSPVINQSKGNGKKPKEFKGCITFQDVHFHYPSRPDVKVLQGLNLTIHPGETVALVGSSGCGKSTTIQLLQRFYDPYSGNICIDDVKLSDFDLNYLRAHIGLVGQEPVLFDVTITENIKYGCPTATKEQIQTAAKKANAHDFIMALPQGYETLVGERGAQLSGGQKQRIAIARALVREPTILLLDEATSALDTNSEVQVQAALDSASKECTTIIIAHRLSTIRGAKRIVVISEGRSVEEGNHIELMQKKGAYYNLVTSQVNSEESIEQYAASEEKETISNGIHAKDNSVTKKVSIAEVEKKVEEAEVVKLSKKALFEIMKLNSPEWWHILIGCLTSVITGAALPIYSIVFGDIIGVLANEDNEFVRTEADRFSIYFFIIGIVTGIATFLQMFMFGIAGEKLTMRVRSLTFEAMLKQEMGWFDKKDNGVGALCTRLSVDAASVQGVSGQPIGTVLNSLSTLTLAIGFSMYFDWRLALVSLSFFPFILVAIYLEQKVVQLDMRESNQSLENSAKLAVEAIGNIRTVASLGCENIFYDLYIKQLMPYYAQSKRTAHVRGLALGLARSLMFFSYAASIYYGAVLVAEEQLDYGIVFKVSEALITGAWSMGNAMAFSPNFQKALTASAKISKFLQRTPEIYDTPNASSFVMKKGNIDYKDVVFSYPTRPDVGVLKGLNLSILHSKTVALVGPSGCGKSTIIQLLERFYDPKSGAVSIDDVNLKDMKLTRLRSHLGIVSQEPNLFDRTIAENIGYGDNNRIVEQAEIIEAAKNANIHNFITSLPMGYDTRLGSKGTQLSGGQKQRIAIARALVRNPRVLLLDEATSALDTESEKIVQEALDNAKKGRTCITIAHRLSTIQDADVICVINNGEIQEMGSHSELLNMKGLYYKLNTMQK